MLVICTLEHLVCAPVILYADPSDIFRRRMEAYLLFCPGVLSWCLTCNFLPEVDVVLVHVEQLLLKLCDLLVQLHDLPLLVPQVLLVRLRQLQPVRQPAVLYNTKHSRLVQPEVLYNTKHSRLLQPEVLYNINLSRLLQPAVLYNINLSRLLV